MDKQTEKEWVDYGDFSLENHGSIFLVRANNTDAWNFLEEESVAAFNGGLDWQFFGHALAVEPRYLTDIVTMLNNEGWRVV